MGQFPVPLYMLFLSACVVHDEGRSKPVPFKVVAVTASANPAPFSMFAMWGQFVSLAMLCQRSIGEATRSLISSLLFVLAGHVRRVPHPSSFPSCVECREGRTSSTRGEAIALFSDNRASVRIVPTVYTVAVVGQ